MMSEKQKNLITRSIFGALFVAIMVLGFTRPHYMVVLFAVITGMTLWEFSGLVNDQKGISVNRFISTAAGVYFFVAVAGQRMGFVEGFSAYIPYILSICSSPNSISRMRIRSIVGLTRCSDRCILPSRSRWSTYWLFRPLQRECSRSICFCP